MIVINSFTILVNYLIFCFREIIKTIDGETLIFDPKIDNNGFFFHGVEQKQRDMLQKVNKNLKFRFDKVLGYSAKNQEVFEETTKNLIGCLMDGYNCSVFAYGATGSGKTYTMLGHNENPGITFLTMAELFKVKDELLEERKFELGISYVEVKIGHVSYVSGLSSKVKTLKSSAYFFFV